MAKEGFLSIGRFIGVGARPERASLPVNPGGGEGPDREDEIEGEDLEEIEGSEDGGDGSPDALDDELQGSAENGDGKAKKGKGKSGDTDGPGQAKISELEKRLDSLDKQNRGLKSVADQALADKAKLLEYLAERQAGGRNGQSADMDGDDELPDDHLLTAADYKKLKQRDRQRQDQRQSQSLMDQKQREVSDAVNSKPDLEEVNAFLKDDGKALLRDPDWGLMTDVGKYHRAKAAMLEKQVADMEKAHKQELDKLKGQRRREKPGYPGVTQGRTQQRTPGTKNPSDFLGYMARRSEEQGIKLDKLGNFIPPGR